jgi:adenylate cyclase
MKSKVLVVDDESDLELLIKQKFRRQIREGKYEFLFAANGIEAFKILQEQADIDLVLSDINMPGMDGLALLVKIGELSPLIKVVMISAYGDMDNIRTAMNRGAYDFVCKPVNFEDLELTVEKTIKHVKQLHETLQAIKENNILRMYVDENVLSFMSRQEFETSLLASEVIEASVVFMDICGFTAITEKTSPDTVVKLINKYFDVMVKEILAQGGHIDKFMGDAVMAVFKGEYHLDRAIEASLAVRAEIQSIHENINNDLAFTPQVATGINSGEMVSGNIGSSSLRRLDYTVIGDVVNVAQRYQSAAKPGQIVIGEEAYQIIKEAFKCKAIGEVQLKNKSQTQMIYEVEE